MGLTELKGEELVGGTEALVLNCGDDISEYADARTSQICVDEHRRESARRRAGMKKLDELPPNKVLK